MTAIRCFTHSLAQGALPLLLLVALCSCIKVDETMTLARDGSGMLDVVYGMPEQMVAQMEAVQAMSERAKSRDDGSGSDPSPGKTEPEFGLEFDPAELRQALKRYESQGVHLERADTETRDGWRFTHLQVRFENLKGLLNTELFEDRRLSLERLPSGDYRLALSDSRGQEQPPPQAKPAEREPTTAAMLEGFHVATTVNTPGRIIETNAHRQSTTSAVWEYDIAKDPNAFTRMGEERPYVVFDGQGLNLPEVRTEP